MDDVNELEVTPLIEGDFDTLDIAREIAALLNDEGFAASAVKADTGRIVLSVELVDERENVRTFRFLGGEVSR